MKWTKKEIGILKDGYAKGVPPKELTKSIKRTSGSIRNKAYQLNIKMRDVVYTDEEIKYIKDNYDTKNLREIAEDLGRGDNYQNICRKARSLGLTNKNRRKVRHKDSPKPRNPYRMVNGKLTNRKYDTYEEGRERQRKAVIEWHKNNPHPRGMLGKTHTEEYRMQISERLKSMWGDPNSYLNSEEHRFRTSVRMSKVMKKRIKENPDSIYSYAKKGMRDDLGFFVRSSWEANVARYLFFLMEKGTIYKFEYEPDTLRFENAKQGIRSYTPDFKVWDTENGTPYYIEVKGFMDDKSKTKLKMMNKHYPEVRVDLIMQKEYNKIKKSSKLIKNWE